MSANTSIEILRVLLQEECLTAKQISEHLHCSRRTVLNYINQVKDLAQKEHLHLIISKGKGYHIADPPEYKRFVYNRYQSVAVPPHQEERLYYVLFILLAQNRPLYMTELEHTFHVSRSSIHTTLKKVEDWLNSYEIHFFQDRKNGLSISHGEKRKRLALSYWHSEVSSLVKDFSSSLGYNDILNLRHALQYFEELLPIENVRSLLSDLQQNMNISISNIEFEHLSRLIQIALIRQSQGFLCKIPGRHFELLTSVQIRKHIHMIMEKVQPFTHSSGNLKEAIYLYTLIMAMAARGEQDAFHFVDSVQIDENCIQDLMEHLDQQIRISESAREAFRERLIYELKREYFFVIYDKSPTGITYYSSMLKRFHIVQDIARILGNITRKYYNVKFNDRYLYTLCLLIRQSIELSKRPLNILFFHNCDSLELDLMHTILKNNFNGIRICNELSCNAPMPSEVFFQRYDLILTTQDTQDFPIPTLVIPKVMDTQEINYLSNQFNYYYQSINYNEIVLKKDFSTSSDAIR